MAPEEGLARQRRREKKRRGTLLSRSAGPSSQVSQSFLLQVVLRGSSTQIFPNLEVLFLFTKVSLNWEAFKSYYRVPGIATGLFGNNIQSDIYEQMLRIKIQPR